MRFSAGLVARQRFLPGTIDDADGMRAAWVPLFIETDAERLARLSQRMPAARALSDPDVDEPPDHPAATVLRTFIAAVADSLVRNPNGAAEVAVPRGRLRKPAFDSVHDAWLNGLKSANGAVHGAPEQLGQLRAQVRVDSGRGQNRTLRLPLALYSPAGAALYARGSSSGRPRPSQPSSPNPNQQRLIRMVRYNCGCGILSVHFSHDGDPTEKGRHWMHPPSVLDELDTDGRIY